MIKDACTIVIQRCSNGYIVNEMKLASDGKTFLGETLVFNEMGYAMGVGESGVGLCLLKFIERHFDVTAVSAGDDRG
jgi:hypothetical protein